MQLADKRHSRDCPRTLGATLNDWNLILGDGTSVGRVGGIDANVLAKADRLHALRDAIRDDELANLASEEVNLEDDMVVCG